MISGDPPAPECTAVNLRSLSDSSISHSMPSFSEGTEAFLSVTLLNSKVALFVPSGSSNGSAFSISLVITVPGACPCVTRTVSIVRPTARTIALSDFNDDILQAFGASARH